VWWHIPVISALWRRILSLRLAWAVYMGPENTKKKKKKKKKPKQITKKTKLL
jgi:hypothetical protein